MKIYGLLHINIRCTVNDLPGLEKFYDEVLGMKSGPRPNFSRPGAWLYLGNEPLIHVNAHIPEGVIAKNRNHSGVVDHIAFKCTNSAEFRERLVRLGIAFHEQNIETAGYQIFVFDPVGTRLEFNFPNSEAPETIAVGTRVLNPADDTR